MRKTFVLLGLVALAAVPGWAKATTPAEGPPKLLAATSAVPPSSVAKILDSLLYDYRVLDLPLAAIDRQVRSTGRLHLRLGDRTLDLTLEQNDLRAEGYRAVLVKEHEIEELHPPIGTFRGVVVGDPDSVVRLSVLPDRFEGYVRTADAWLFVDPLDRFAPGADPARVVVYRDVDARPDSEAVCGTEHLHRLVDEVLPRLPAGGGVSAKAFTSGGTLRLATDGDGELVQRYGQSGAASRILNIVNNVDGIYRSTFNLKIRIVFQLLWASPSIDPYTSTESGTRLEQFRSYWEANFDWVSRDNAHLFTGVTLDRSVAGLAKGIGVVCRNSQFSYALSEDRSSMFQMTQIVAHEIGHCVGAYHDDDLKSYCSGVVCNGSGPLMCSSIQVNGSNQFSVCSWGDVCDHIELCLVDHCMPP